MTTLFAAALFAIAAVQAQQPPPKGETPPATRPAPADLAAAAAELSSDDAETRDRAAETLRAAGKPAVPYVVGVLQEPKTEARRLAARLLGDLRATEAGTALRRRLPAEPDEFVRVEICYALAWVGGEGTVEALSSALRFETSVRVLRAAVVAFADLEDPRGAEPVLNFAERTEDAYLRRIAVRTLASLTGKNFRDDVPAWRRWWEEYGEKFLRTRRSAEGTGAGKH